MNFDLPPLPDSEAPPMDFTRGASSPSTAPATDDLFDDSNAGAVQDAGAGGFDFDAFLGGVPADLPPQDLNEPPSLDDLFDNIEQSYPAADESPADEFQTDEFPADDFPAAQEQEASAGDDFSIDDFLPAPAADESPADEFPADDFSAPEEQEASAGDDFAAGADSTANESFDLGDFEMPEEPSESDSGSGIDFGGESFETESASETSPGAADFASDDFPSDFGSDFDSSLPDFDSGGETEFSSEDAGDSTEPVDFGSDFASGSIELDTEAEEQVPVSMPGGASGGDEFSIPGLEEIFDKPKTTTITAPAPKKSLLKRKKPAAREEYKADKNVEEIRLTQDEVDNMVKTLGSYPLNLRVACEELIAEKVLLPQQLSKLIFLLKSGAGVRETAALAEELLGKPIIIPRSFEKMTGAAFEAEQASFAHIFVHNFLPVLRLFAFIAAVAASAFYLGYRFIYIPVKAENIYKRGYERIPAGEYQRANQLFNEAFATHRKKKWFYLYAEEFRDQRRYLLAEEKYDDLLRYYPRDKKGVLDYAHLETYYLLNYDKANRLLQQQLIDYAPADYDGLLAAGDNFLLWGDSDPEKFYDRYEDARFSYARVLDNYGWTAPVIERMMKYFIRTDNLKEVLNCRAWFENDPKAKLSPPSLAELGGYLLDKQLEEVKGVPDAYVESIESVRGMLLEAVRGDTLLPEPHYHLARYYHWLGNTYEERLTLENAIRAFDLARTETVQRRKYRVDTHFRYANLLINNREFFPAEEQIVRGIQLYEDFLSRNLIPASPQLGQLYAAMGDLEYFVKAGDMNAALNDYRLAERYGYSPPEVQYRMGSAYYQLQDWRNALEYLVKASADLPLNRRLLYALGNVSYQRGDYFAAQGYYTRLIDILESQRVRMPVLLPNDNPQFLELGERIMMAMNNAGVVYEMLANQTTNRNFRSTAIAYYAESARAWDSITRNPETMIRMNLAGNPGIPGINLGYLNAGNAIRPASDYSPEIFVRIDKDVLEPSKWEELAPGGGLR
jgi:tetratricopeptide (TPR) repeat protein